MQPLLGPRVGVPDVQTPRSSDWITSLLQAVHGSEDHSQHLQYAFVWSIAYNDLRNEQFEQTFKIFPNEQTAGLRYVYRIHIVAVPFPFKAWSRRRPLRDDIS